jgi:hypothetical protein
LQQDRHFRQSHRPAAAPSQKDVDQDTRIAALEQETRELRIYVAALIRLLCNKQTLSLKETSNLISLAARVERTLPASDQKHPAKLAELIDPVAGREQH